MDTTSFLNGGDSVEDGDPIPPYAIKGEASVIRPIKTKIRFSCKQRRIRLEQFFDMFDRTKTKKCTKAQFARALHMAGLELTPGEVLLLQQRYELENDSNMVAYRRFTDQINKAFTLKDLEKSPTKEVRTSLEGMAGPCVGLNNPVLTSGEVTQLAEILDAIRHTALTEGMIIKSLFKDFDRNNDGCVTKDQFLRNCHACIGHGSQPLDNSGAALMVKAYSAEGLRGVNYRQLHVDTSGGGLADGPQIPSDGGRRTASIPSYAPDPNPLTAGEVDVDALEAELAVCAVQDRLRVLEFFQDYDPMRTGLCTQGEFVRGLTACFASYFGLAGAQAKIDTLCHKYQNGGKIRYAGFCRQVAGDGPVGCLSVGGGDDQASTALSFATASVSQWNCPVLAPEEETMLDDILEHIRAVVTQKRVLLKPTFQDFDRRREDHVSREQFMRALSMFDILPPTAQGVNVLCKQYAPQLQDVRHAGSRYVHYRRFLEDIDPSLDPKQNQGGGKGFTESAFKKAAAVSPEKSLALTGQGSFGGGDSGQLQDGDSLEEGDTLAGTPARALRRRFMGRDERSVREVMRQIKGRALRNRVRLDEYFRDQDKLRHGVITRSQFARGLAVAGHHLSENELEALCAEYVKAEVACEDGSVRTGVDPGPIVDPAGQPLVAWKLFCDDVDSIFTKKWLERTPQLDVEQSCREAEDEDEGALAPVVQFDEETKCSQCLVDLAHEVSVKRMELAPTFQDFDRAKRGYVPSTIFKRVLSMMGLLPSPVLVEILVRKFCEPYSQGASGSGHEDVNYKAFLNALLAVGAGGDPKDVPGAALFRATTRKTAPTSADLARHAAPRATLLGAGGTSSLQTVNDVIEELRRQIAVRQIRASDFFAEADRLRSGEISVPKFCTALTRANLELDSSELDLLQKAFRSDRHGDMVDWRAFLRKLEAGGFTQSGFDRSRENQRVDDLLARIKVAVDRRRLHFKPIFQDYDRNNSQQVTQTQFSAVLDRMNLGISITNEDRQILHEAFRVYNGRKPTDRVNYKQFVQSVDAGGIETAV